ncbi:ATPase AAA domain-containing protein 5 [Gonapodya sp. JEL0774]|nr:ATPase AAA domain-containing protein 5 [Gonapodya sp. JEL0774]
MAETSALAAAVDAHVESPQSNTSDHVHAEEDPDRKADQNAADGVIAEEAAAIPPMIAQANMVRLAIISPPLNSSKLMSFIKASQSESAKKRRGRPPKPKLAISDSAADSPESTPAEPLQPVSRRRGRPPKTAKSTTEAPVPVTAATLPASSSSSRSLNRGIGPSFASSKPIHPFFVKRVIQSVPPVMAPPASISVVPDPLATPGIPSPTELPSKVPGCPSQTEVSSEKPRSCSPTVLGAVVGKSEKLVSESNAHLEQPPEPILIPDSPFRHNRGVAIAIMPIEALRSDQVEEIPTTEAGNPELIVPASDLNGAMEAVINTPHWDSSKAAYRKLVEDLTSSSSSSAPRRSLRRPTKHNATTQTVSPQNLPTQPPNLPGSALTKPINVATTPDFFLTPAQRAQKAVLMATQAREAAQFLQSRRLREEVERRDAEAKKHAEAMGTRGEGIIVNPFFDKVKKRAEEVLVGGLGGGYGTGNVEAVDAAWPGQGLVHIARDVSESTGARWKHGTTVGQFRVASPPETTSTGEIERRFPFVVLEPGVPDTLPRHGTSHIRLTFPMLISCLRTLYGEESLAKPSCARLLSRLSNPTSLSATHQSASELLCDKYAPTAPSEVLANGDLAIEVADWLRSWKVSGPEERARREAAAALVDRRARRRGRGRRKPPGSDDDDFVVTEDDLSEDDMDDEPPSLGHPTTSTLLLVGPPGSCKTALVKVVAAMEGYEVMEMGANERRNRTDVSGVVGGIATTHVVKGVGSALTIGGGEQKANFIESMWSKLSTVDLVGEKGKSGTRMKKRRVLDDADDSEGDNLERYLTGIQFPVTASRRVDGTSSDTFIVIEDEEECTADITMVEDGPDNSNGGFHVQGDGLTEAHIPAQENDLAEVVCQETDPKKYRPNGSSDSGSDYADDDDFQPGHRRAAKPHKSKSMLQVKRSRGRPPKLTSSIEAKSVRAGWTGSEASHDTLSHVPLAYKPLPSDSQASVDNDSQASEAQEVLGFSALATSVSLSADRNANSSRVTDAPTQAIIVFEQADVVYRDDRDFWKIVAELAAESRRPIVLTANDATLSSHLPPALEPFMVVRELQRPSVEELAPYLNLVALLEGKWVDPVNVGKIALHCEGDVSKALAELEMMARASATPIEIDFSTSELEQMDLCSLSNPLRRLKRAREEGVEGNGLYQNSDGAKRAKFDLENDATVDLHSTRKSPPSLILAEHPALVPYDSVCDPGTGVETNVEQCVTELTFISDRTKAIFSSPVSTVRIISDLEGTSPASPPLPVRKQNLILSMMLAAGATILNSAEAVTGSRNSGDDKVCTAESKMDNHFKRHLEDQNSIQVALNDVATGPNEAPGNDAPGLQHNDDLSANLLQYGENPGEAIDILFAYAEFMDAVGILDTTFCKQWVNFMVQEPDLMADDLDRLESESPLNQEDYLHLYPILRKPLECELGDQRYRQCFAGESDSASMLRLLIGGARNILNEKIEQIVTKWEGTTVHDENETKAVEPRSGTEVELADIHLGRMLLTDLESDRYVLQVLEASSYQCMK